MFSNILSHNPLTTKTFWGVVLTIGAWLYKQPHFDVPTILEGLGGVLTGVGARDVAAKFIKS